MKLTTILSGIVLAIGSVTLTSCGSSTEVRTTNERSVGQQLTDLEQARQQGIITESEYASLKKAIIKKND